MEYEPYEILCGGSTGPGADQRILFKANICTLTPVPDQYVPHSGNYRVEINAAIQGTFSTWNFALTSAAYFDENIPIDQQNITVHGQDYDPGLQPPLTLSICYRLIDESGQKYYLKTVETMYSNCTGSPPLPPTPPEPPTSCSINNGNALNVTLDTLDRAQLATTPGTGTARHISVPVQCTGEVDSIPVNMQLNYTPLTVNGIQTVKSSANGVGVAIIYNNAPLSNSDIVPISFVPGSNQVDLAFEAVRDPAVTIGDVPTGAFTASATVIITQQ
ncbi:fimbrial protein [Citrobacter amalonaticus]|uniref:fimbrial protein n=1 Tax=Citrobacter amalonaticus TaxID=35703 RepID=UPI00300D7530